MSAVEIGKESQAMQPGLRIGYQDSLLAVRGLRKSYTTGSAGLFGGEQRTVRAVDGVSFDVARGETFGLVGESGCGKSTVARCVLHLITPTAGEIRFDGVDLGGLGRTELQKLRRRMQIVFQDPYTSLDPRMTAFSIVDEPLVIHGVQEREERERRVEEILDLVGITPEQMDRRPFAFSGGQRQRIGLARALVLNPDLVVLDEPETLFRAPLHPYTNALLSAVPLPDPRRERQRKRIIIKGEASLQPGAIKGCRFQPRCPVGRDRDICGQVDPPLQEKAPGHWAACHFAGELST
jgi:oligopeptide/dipeptide ABC transporter ATP-binding protein